MCHQKAEERQKETADCSLVTLSTHPVACKTTASVACHQGQGRRDKEHTVDCSLNCDTVTTPAVCMAATSAAYYLQEKE